MDIEQLQQAVQMALGSADATVREQALEYCNSVRNSPQAWEWALQILSAHASPETVFFAYQVLELWLPQLNSQQVEAVRAAVWEHYLVVVAGDPVAHLKSKLASVMAALFLLCYPTWPSYFRDLRAIESPVGTEMYVRILYAIHEEIGDTLILHDANAIKRNNMLKDLIRENDMAAMIDSWVEILAKHTPPQTEQAQRIVDQLLQVIGGYVSWVDIGALLSENMRALLFKQFDTPLRLTAADTVHDIVAKKMSPQNKLELLLLLDVASFAKAQSQNQDEEFRGRFARTLSGLAIELLIVLNNSDDAAVSNQTEALLMELMPYVVDYFRSGPLEVTSQIVTAINEYFQWVRKEAKKQSAAFDTSSLSKNSYGQFVDFPRDSTFIPEGRRTALKLLFECAIEKSLFEDDWQDPEGEFLELRSRLSVLQDQCSSIDIDLFVDEIAAFVTKNFEGAASWEQAELALYELGIFSEVVKTQKAPRGTTSRPQQVLLHLFMQMINSDIVKIPHPSIQLHFMDLVYRHGQYLERLERPSLMKALDVFLRLGVHNQNRQVRERSWYLFYKVFKIVRKQLAEEPSVGATIFGAISTLLVIDDEDEETFKTKLYLFELCGLLFVNSGYENGELTHQLLERLFGGLQKDVESAASAAGDELALQRVNRKVMALGTFTRGMNDAVVGDFRASPVASEMHSASKMVIAVLQELPAVKSVREACRYTMSRFVALLGSAAIVEISQLINCLLNACTLEELAEFLGFLGQLAHTFKTDEDMFGMFSSLCVPLFEKIFLCLEQADVEAQGGSTDSQVLRKSVIQGYIQFLQALFNNRYGSIFLVDDANHKVLQNVIKSLFHYGTNQKDVQSQKLAIICLEKIVGVWGTGSVPSGEVGEGKQVPLFSTPEVYSNLTELCWSVTDYPLRDAQTRLVVMELGGLQKCMWDARGEWYGDLVLKYLEKAGLDGQLARGVVGQLASMSAKDFKRSYYEFLVQISS